MVICSICGGTSFKDNAVLWPALIAEWEIDQAETAYIDRQQGTQCTKCGANLRVIALGEAILFALRKKVVLKKMVKRSRSVFSLGRKIRLLDLNGAATISDTLVRMPGYERHDYPQVDMQSMPFADDTFDIVIHSDTLEHVPDPVKALVECHRVLKPGGTLCFTIPIIVGRMTRSRTGMPPSYHGDVSQDGDDWRVHTEFGADAWLYLIKAGFDNIRINAVDSPSAHALSAVKR